MDLIFYDSPFFLLMYAVNVLNIKGDYKLIKFLSETGNKDVAEAIKDGRIKLEWSDK